MLFSQLEYFRVVARHEHISRAAEELCVAQPAISTTISKLEKEMGVPLFDRVGRNIELNAAGQRLLHHANYLFEQLDAMEQALEQTKEILENEVTIAVNNSMFLGNWLQQFIQSNPKIRLQQKMLSEQQMVEALMEESIDVAIGEFDYDIPGIVSKIIVEDAYVFITSPEHRLAAHDKIYFEDICEEDIIALPSNTIHKISDKIFKQKNCAPHVVFEGNQRLMTRALQQNRGILFASRQMLYMPYQALMQSDASGNFFFIAVKTLEDIDCKSNLSIYWKKDRELPAMAHKFIEAMEQTYPRYSDDATYMGRKLIPWFRV